MTCNVPAFATLAIATALNNSTAGISQLVAQWIWKDSEEDAGFPTGNFTCAAMSFTTALIAFGLRFTYGYMNRNKTNDITGNDRIWLL